MSHATKSRKRVKPARSIRLALNPSGGNPGMLTITVGKEAADYFLTEVPADFGRGFKVEKVGGEEVYHVNLDGAGNSNRGARTGAGSNPPPPATGGHPCCSDTQPCAATSPASRGTAYSAASRWANSRSFGCTPRARPPGPCCTRSDATAGASRKDVPRGWLRKSRRGLWYSVRDVPFGRVTRLIDFASAAEPCAA